LSAGLACEFFGSKSHSKMVRFSCFLHLLPQEGDVRSQRNASQEAIA
jgi:hypothetical protein